VPVIDTDLLARELVEPGQPTLDAIVQAFGAELLDATGRLDRRRLRERIFGDPAERRRLEAILHPAIAARAHARIAQIGAPWCLLVVPLLAETGRFAGADRVLLVEADAATRIDRLTARDGVSRAQAEAALAAQASDAARRALADDVIDNSGAIAALDAQVRRLDARYRALAAAQAGA